MGGTSKTTIYGIYDVGTVLQTCKLFHNTVYLSGTLASGSTNKSYCLYNLAGANIRDFRNNIFFNARSTSAGTSLHYAISQTANSNLTCDYNDYFTTGIGGVLGYLAGDKSTLSAWQLATLKDVNSLIVDPELTTAGGVIAANYIPLYEKLAGEWGTGITTDFTTANRFILPTIGAYNNDLSLSVEVWQGGVYQAQYLTLKSAFDLINSGFYTGAIDLKIIDNTTETATATLYQSGYNGTSNYSSIRIFPTVAGKSVTGNLAAPLIDFNGADNVTIDGRVNATGSTKDLTITNTSISNVAGTSTIRFINDATNNIVRYSSIKGSETSTLGGIVFFSTGTTAGNDNNTIDNNNITCSVDINRPHVAIYSLGTSIPKSNSENTVSNNNIYDFLSRSSHSFGIYLYDYTTAWSITGNSFYLTTPQTPTGDFDYAAINIDYVTGGGNGFTIKDNYIGGTLPLCEGTAWTNSSTFKNVFWAIYLKGMTGTASSIQNNTIRNFIWNSSGISQWNGIVVSRGDVNVGTISGNTVGASTGTGAITANFSTTGEMYGISSVSTGFMNCQNNVVGSITSTNSAGSSASIYAISSWYGASTMSNNAIGSTVTANSINATSASAGAAQEVYGIYNYYAGTITMNTNVIANLTNGTTNTTAATAGLINGITTTAGTNTITNNTVRNLTIANANSSATNTASAAGIVHSATALATITGNTIYNISNTYPSFVGNVNGIYFSGGAVNNNLSNNTVYGLSSSATTAASVTGINVNTTVITNTVSGNKINNLSLPNTAAATAANVIGLSFAAGVGGTNEVTRNFIHSLSTSAASTTANIYGLKIVSGATTYSNNIVSLGGNTATNIYGIYETGGTLNNSTIYHNTIYIGGAPTIGNNNSYALYSAVTTNVRNFRNNIFSNVRSNSGTASGNHYAAYFNYGDKSNLTANYNNYYAPGNGGILSHYNNSNIYSLPMLLSLESNSLNKNPIFINAGSTIASNYQVGTLLKGEEGIDILIDFGSTARALPTMGAWESDAALPINLVNFTVHCNDNKAMLKWQTASETNNNYFEIQQSNDMINWSVVTKYPGQGNSNNTVNYSYVDEKAYSSSYYRLAQVDYNGTRTLFASTFFSCNIKDQTYKLYPNPANDYVVVEIPETDLNTTYQLFNSLGKQLILGKFNELSNQIDVHHLSAGIYYLRVEKAPNIVLKVIKQ